MEKIIQISCSSEDLYALTSDGKVYIRTTKYENPDRIHLWEEILPERRVRVSA